MIIVQLLMLYCNERNSERRGAKVSAAESSDDRIPGKGVCRLLTIGVSDNSRTSTEFKRLYLNEK